jgi:pyridoxal phosphate enzyme (YggS family)
MDFASKLAHLHDRIDTALVRSGRPTGSVRCIVVTKGQPVELIEKLYDCGVKEIGESRVLDAVEKLSRLPQDVSCHLIGTLQRNKAIHATRRFALVHSVDSIELAEKLDAVSSDIEGPIPVLLQVNPIGELTKRGFSPNQLSFACERILQLPRIRICGLMSMAPHRQVGEETVEKAFDITQQLFYQLKNTVCTSPDFRELSMGMSQDFEIAIRYGSTLVRIGSLIFT